MLQANEFYLLVFLILNGLNILLLMTAGQGKFFEVDTRRRTVFPERWCRNNFQFVQRHHWHF